ncbi:MAG: NAD-dependent epimerase/dehydratase family protein [Bacteroidia bacterium]|nr:NAD-dependent epimerase/dehydratase family protein [Bacteroidia bacterium]
MTSKVLVTGASGLLGAQLCKYLIAKGTSVRALVRNKHNTGLLAPYQDKLEIVEGDILDIYALEQALEGISQVYHCAAVVSFAKKDRNLMKKINVEGTANLVNLCVEKPGIRLLHVSSIAALGDTEGKITEKTKWKDSPSVTFYAKTKHLAELEVYRGIEEGLDAVMVLPSIIIGQGRDNHPFMRLFKRAIKKGIPWYHHGVTGYIGVDDVVQGMYIVMQQAPKGEKYILNSENLSFYHFLSLISEIFDTPKPKYKIPYRLTYNIARIVELIYPGHAFLNRETIKSSIKQQEYSAQKFIESFSFRFKPIKECLLQMKQSIQA